MLGLLQLTMLAARFGTFDVTLTNTLSTDALVVLDLRVHCLAQHGGHCHKFRGGGLFQDGGLLHLFHLSLD